MAVIGEGVDVVDRCLPAASADLTSTVAIDICQQGELEPRRRALIDDLKGPRMRLRRVLLVAKGAHVQVEVLVGGRSGASTDSRFASRIDSITQLTWTSCGWRTLNVKIFNGAHAFGLTNRSVARALLQVQLQHAVALPLISSTILIHRNHGLEILVLTRKLRPTAYSYSVFDAVSRYLRRNYASASLTRLGHMKDLTRQPHLTPFLCNYDFNPLANAATRGNYIFTLNSRKYDFGPLPNSLDCPAETIQVQFNTRESFNARTIISPLKGLCAVNSQVLAPSMRRDLVLFSYIFVLLGSSLTDPVGLQNANPTNLQRPNLPQPYLFQDIYAGTIFTPNLCKSVQPLASLSKGRNYAPVFKFFASKLWTSEFSLLAALFRPFQLCKSSFNLLQDPCHPRTKTMPVVFTHRTMPFLLADNYNVTLQVRTQFPSKDRDYALLLPDIYTVTMQVECKLIQDLSASRLFKSYAKFGFNLLQDTEQSKQVRVERRNFAVEYTQDIGAFEQTEQGHGNYKRERSEEAGDAEITLGCIFFIRFKSIRGRSITTAANVSSEELLRSCGLTRLASLPPLAQFVLFAQLAVTHQVTAPPVGTN
ncbi:hypothetical protein C8J57DRAFT_1569814 [Mycena rebaudengoi]|nr:hypothetical protein C8J57DRAFT_1569814 [Mycena rebaudengoi]